MPYIKPNLRTRFDDLFANKSLPADAGELNYVITKLCDRYLLVKGLNYGNLNEVVGVLECAKLEFFRRVAANYENSKIEANGDVYEVKKEIK
jgi:hypothetical protein